MSLLTKAARLAVKRGMSKGSRELLVTGVVLGLAGWSKKRHDESQSKVLHREVLEPGQSIAIRVLDRAMIKQEESAQRRPAEPST